MDGISKHVVVIGAGGHGSEVVSYIRDIAKAHHLTLLGVIDDNKPVGAWNGTSILGGPSVLRELSIKLGKIRYITAVGDNVTRRALVDKLDQLKIPNLEPLVITHSSASLGSCHIGAGTLLAPNTILTTNVSIGSHCILNVKVSVSHDVVVEDFCNLNPGCTITGNVHLEEGSYIGAGATILPGVRVGKYALVGGGALINKDVPAYSTVVGVPARVIKSPAAKLTAGSKG